MMTFDIDMPGRPIQRWYAQDTAKLGDLAMAAFEILGQCVQSWTSPMKKTGWKNIGMLRLVSSHSWDSIAKERVAGAAQSIGVILWSTGSVEDRRVPPWPPTATRSNSSPIVRQ